MKMRNTLFKRIRAVLLWIAAAFAMGTITGLLGGAFDIATVEVTLLRLSHPILLFLLPVGGIVIYLIYHLAKYDEDKGVGAVILGLQRGERVYLRITPLIFAAATLSHLAGASVGRIGSALQMGGSVGQFFGRVFKLSEDHKKTLMMCGISGVFSALFGTPVAGSIFSIEMSVVGQMPFGALLPCIITSFSAKGVGVLMGAPYISFDIENLPAFGADSLLLTALLAALSGLVSILYCVSIQKIKVFAQYLIKNPYLRCIVFGGILLLVSLIFGSQTYNGLGSGTIQDAFNGEVIYYAFLIKILFTSLSGAAGYKGGDVFPAIFIGAAFGAMFGSVCGHNPSFCAGIGVGAMFCGITNCPITSFLICMELFGVNGAVFYLITIAISYLTSGYFGIFPFQKFAHSKYRMKYH